MLRFLCALVVVVCSAQLLPAQCYDKYPDNCTSVVSDNPCSDNDCVFDGSAWFCQTANGKVGLNRPFDAITEGNYYGYEHLHSTTVVCGFDTPCDTVNACQAANFYKCSAKFPTKIKEDTGILSDDCYYEY